MWRTALILFLFPIVVGASNAGIVRGLWYSNETLYANVPTRVYIAVRNSTGADLSGTVEFFVNDKKIERSKIAALDGRIVESWADWTPPYGTSTISATLSRTEISSTASGTSAIEVVSALAEDVVFVDYDTDGDGVGNAVDTDDDNDGIPDAEEIKGDTDPLDPHDPAPEPESDEDSTAASSNSNENETGSTSVTNKPATARSFTTSSDGPVGLEQYLTPSPANTVLSNITETINNTKKRVDAFREKRDHVQSNSGELNIAVNEDGFGEIERTSTEEKRKPVAEKPDGFFGDLITFIGNVGSAVFTGILFVVSWVLGHPMLMQILLLILILFLVWKLARRFGRRPQ